MSGAITSREQDRGRPPPRMSSKEAIPDDVRMVEDENGEARVAGRRPTVLELDFLLKVDMILDNAGCRTLDSRRTGGGAGRQQLPSHLIP